MSLDLLVQAAQAPPGDRPSFPASDSKESRLKLQASLVFLDGKKLGPLRTLDKMFFEELDAHLAWMGGPSVCIRFNDSKSLDTLRSAAEAAQKRASKAPVELGSGPVHAARVIATPQAQLQRHRPQFVSGQKRPAEVQVGSNATAAKDTEDDDRPVSPLVDATLTEDDREKRRKLAAICAEERATQVQMRGIGDASCAQRIQERAEREELIGRITERYTMQRNELPWRIGGAPIAELRAHLKSLTTKQTVAAGPANLRL